MISEPVVNSRDTMFQHLCCHQSVNTILQEIHVAQISLPSNQKKTVVHVMGGGTSSHARSVNRQSEIPLQSSILKRRAVRPRRKIFFCHSCNSFSYDSHPDVQRSCLPLICPHPFCRPRLTTPLEEIHASIEGNLRLQAIMLELINLRAASRPRNPVFNGASTADIILETDVMKSIKGDSKDIIVCSVCNDNIDCCEVSCSQTHGFSESDMIMKLQCGHRFHKLCILPWLAAHRTCPCCRTLVKRWDRMPTAVKLFEMFDEDQLARKIEFAMTTKTYLIGKEVESAMMSDRKEDCLLTKAVNSERALSCITSDAKQKEELSNRLHEILIRVLSA